MGETGRCGRAWSSRCSSNGETSRCMSKRHDDSRSGSSMVAETPCLPRPRTTFACVVRGVWRWYSMRRAPSNRIVPGALLLILGALSSGLPSHHHGGDLDEGPRIEAADHHGHGVILTEQTGQLPSAPVATATPARATSLRVLSIVAVPAARPSYHTRPHERPPPTTSPRAPPVPS